MMSQSMYFKGFGSCKILQKKQTTLKLRKPPLAFDARVVMRRGALYNTILLEPSATRVSRNLVNEQAWRVF